MGVPALACLSVLLASVSAFTPLSSFTPSPSALKPAWVGASLSRSPLASRSLVRRGSVQSPEILTLRASSLQDRPEIKTDADSESAAATEETANGKPVMWKDASPQRVADRKTTRYLNQFPNTWQPAEKLALARAVTEDNKDYFQSAGVQLNFADPKKVYDAAVVGSGPAALSLAAELAAEGMSVAVLGPVSGAWPNNYGVWVDEWDELGLPESCKEYSYEQTRITITNEKSITIPRAYAKVSGQKTRTFLLEKCAKHGVEVLETMVEKVVHGEYGENSHMACTGGLVLNCKIPVVAAGHYSPLVKYNSPGVEFMRIEGEYMTRDWNPLLQVPEGQRMKIEQGPMEQAPLQKLDWRSSVQFDSVRPGHHTWGWNWGWNPVLRGIKVPEIIPFFGGSTPLGGGAPGYQIAYGITVETKEPHGFPLDEMLLMDFSVDHLQGDTELEGGIDGHTPSFLYAFPYDENHVFLQETLLVARNHRATAKSIEMEEMVRRTNKRIDHFGLDVVRRYDEEYSVIPMGGPLPVLGQPTVGYGAAGIMAHPASGYMINRVILQAPEVAEAMAEAWRSTECPQRAAEAGWEAIWPKHRLIERDLYCFGMEVLLDLDVKLLQDFFATFFSNPKETMWREFLAWNMTKPGEKPWKMSIFMIMMFFRGSNTLRARLVKEAMFKDGLHLLKSIFNMPFPFD